MKVLRWQQWGFKNSARFFKRPKEDEDYVEIRDKGIFCAVLVKPKDLRRLSAWLLKAADLIEARASKKAKP